MHARGYFTDFELEVNSELEYEPRTDTLSVFDRSNDWNGLSFLNALRRIHGPG